MEAAEALGGPGSVLARASLAALGYSYCSYSSNLTSGQSLAALGYRSSDSEATPQAPPGQTAGPTAGQTKGQKMAAAAAGPDFLECLNGIRTDPHRGPGHHPPPAVADRRFDHWFEHWCDHWCDH